MSYDRSLKTLGRASVLMAAAFTALFGSGHPANVCEVLSNIDSYQGKEVAIRGILRGGRHGEFLQDAFGDEPCEEVRKQRHTWPSAVAITQYTTGSDLEGGPVAFVSDVRQIWSALADARSRVAQDSSLAIVATFTGELRSKKDLQIRRSPEGWYYGNGYGQSGQYPALLIVRTVRDVSVIKKQSKGRPYRLPGQNGTAGTH